MTGFSTPQSQPDTPRASVGYVWVPHLPLAVALRSHPELAGVPILVSGDGDAEGSVVVDASDECLDSGVRTGRSLREAREFRPDAAILEVDPREEQRAQRTLLEALAVVAPTVEDDGPGRGYFAPDRTLDYEDSRWVLATIREIVRVRLGFGVQLALAPNKFTARVAAERDPDAGAGTPVVLSGETGAYLSTLPIEALPLKPRALERLRLLGIATIGEFAKLPRGGIARRFGREAVTAHSFARGLDERQVVGRKAPESRTARRTFEFPLDTLAPALAAAESLLERLCSEMLDEGKTFRTLGIVLEDENADVTERSAQLRTPAAETAACRSTLRGLVEAAAGDSPVIAVSVKLSGLEPLRLEQPALFDIASGREDRRRRLAEATREIGRRYPRRLRRVSPSEIPTLLDEHRFRLLPYEPGDLPTPSEVLPRAHQRVRVERRGGRPYLIEEGREDGLVTVCGCWRAEEWWPEEVDRVYWRVRMRSGRILTLSRDSTGFRLVEVMD